MRLDFPEDDPWTRARAVLWGVSTPREAERLLAEPRGGWNFGRRARKVLHEDAEAANRGDRFDPLALDLEDEEAGDSALRLRTTFPDDTGWVPSTGSVARYRGGYVENIEELVMRYRKTKGQATIRCTYCGRGLRSRDLQKLFKWWRVHC
jgi:hypothetical protein